MKVTVLGSGTSVGVPMIGCRCPVCLSPNPKNRRLRSSCLFSVRGKNLLIDTSPDLRLQALTHGLERVDAVLYTHDHADHVHGIDDLRMFNVIQGATIPVFCDEGMVGHLKKKFSYIFPPVGSEKSPYFTPQLSLHAVSGRFDCVGVPVQMIPCEHGPKGITMNYRIGDVAWLTDTSGISEGSLQKLQGLDVLFIDGLRLKPHPTHLHLEAALAYARRIAARRTYLIHLTHDYDHEAFNAQLPDGIALAYDGLTLESQDPL